MNTQVSNKDLHRQDCTVITAWKQWFGTA